VKTDHTNVMCVTSNLVYVCILADTCVYTVANVHTYAVFVTSNLLRVAICRHIWLYIVE